MVAYWERKQVPAEDLGVGWETGVWVWTVKNPENKVPGQAQGLCHKVYEYSQRWKGKLLLLQDNLDSTDASLTWGL